MIVDDEQPIADGLADIVTSWVIPHLDGVDKAYSAQQAIERMKNEPVEILLTDIRMPGIDGIELIRQVLSVCLMMIRVGDQFSRYDSHDLILMEYALYNIISELMEAHFHLWHAKDGNGNLVYVLTPLIWHVSEEATEAMNVYRWDESELGLLGESIRLHVGDFLKADILISFSEPGSFPWQLPSLYESAAGTLLRMIESSGMSTASEGMSDGGIQSLSALYETPSLVHLLQNGQWDNARAKLEEVFRELEVKWGGSQEHLLEAYHAIYQSYLFIAHKNGRMLTEICGSALINIKSVHTAPFLSMRQLKNWSMDSLNKLVAQLTTESNDGKKVIVRKVQAFIQKKLAVDVSLQRIAEHVYLHPSSLSKLYRAETGQSITDYVFQVRMSKAEHLLLNTRSKVQDIAAACGYQSTPYFIKVFREYSGMTPLEFRGAAE